MVERNLTKMNKKDLIKEIDLAYEILRDFLVANSLDNMGDRACSIQISVKVFDENNPMVETTRNHIIDKDSVIRALMGKY